MQESHVQKIAVSCTVVGLIVLFLFLQSAEFEVSTLGELEGMEDETVVTEGIVLGVNKMDTVTFLIIQKEETATVTLFGPTPTLEPGDLVQVRGVVEIDSEGGADIMGEEVRLIG